MNMPVGTVHKLGPYELSSGLLRSVHEAADKTGVPFSFLLAKAGKESAFNPALKAQTSSATGLYQFTRQTWFEQISKHGADYGLKRLADAVESRGGTFSVPDPTLRREILDLRADPTVSAAMAAEYAARNAEILAGRLGRTANEQELYLAHFLGPTGAADMLAAGDLTPDRAARDVAPQAARANRTLFYDMMDGSPLSVRDMIDQLAAKFGVHLENARQLDAELSQAGYADLYGNEPPYPAARMAQGAPVISAQMLSALMDVSDLATPVTEFSAITGTAPGADTSARPDPMLMAAYRRYLAPMPGVEAVSANRTNARADLDVAAAKDALGASLGMEPGTGLPRLEQGGALGSFFRTVLNRQKD